MLSQFIYHLQRIIIHDIIITVHFHIKIYIFFMTDLEIFTAFWLRSKCLYISQKRVSAKTVYEFSIHIPWGYLAENIAWENSSFIGFIPTTEWGLGVFGQSRAVRIFYSYSTVSILTINQIKTCAKPWGSPFIHYWRKICQDPSRVKNWVTMTINYAYS